MRYRFLLSLSFLFAGILSASVTDYSGNWVANIEKSQLGAPPPKSWVMKVEKIGPDAYRHTTTQVSADGKEQRQQFTRTHDGKEHAVEGAPKELTETCTEVDPLTRHIVGKYNGKVSYVIDAKMEPDRKTMTSRQTRYAPDGKISEVRVSAWERQ